MTHVNARTAPAFLLLACLLGAQAGTAYAQMFSYTEERATPIQALAAGYHFVDFRYNGSERPDRTFDFAAPVYALYYARPSFLLTVAYGRESVVEAQREAQRLIDATLFLWGEVPLSRSPRTRTYLPIVLHSGYRGVGANPGPSMTGDSFNLTTVGIGTGLGFGGRFGQRLTLEARATPLIAVATRSFEGQAGTSSMLDADLQAHLNRLFNRFGLTLGYGFRAQQWNVGTSNLLQHLPDDYFNYRSQQHTLRLGVNW